ncbi:MAG: acetyl-CoA carboxylase biotin carboxyl carrier protein subunit [Candidatus Cloacimonadota bacterium]|nr:MAG: acetyl-CoA carboxylase biotin carboxyl carrier protein subunit [Candidatus Cloacimonadota bacterium]
MILCKFYSFNQHSMAQTKDLKSDTKKPSYKSLLIENIKYRTLLTKKYQQKKPFVRKDVKKVTAFIPGTILNIYVKKNKRVKEGEKLLVLEAMKMRNELTSPIEGTIKDIYIKEGSRVTKGELLVEFI